MVMRTVLIAQWVVCYDFCWRVQFICADTCSIPDIVKYIRSVVLQLARILRCWQPSMRRDQMPAGSTTSFPSVGWDLYVLLCLFNDDVVSASCQNISCFLNLQYLGFLFVFLLLSELISLRIWVQWCEI
jgi:hypothetical protein